MLRVKPFAALRPKAAQAAEIASVPYDVVSTDEARRLAEGHPLSFLHVVRSEIDLPPETDPHADVVYQRALSNFRALERDVLVRDAPPGIYVYRLEATLLGKQVSQTGVVCACHVADYMNGVIRRHETTRQDKEDDRTRHVLSLNANAGPVFLMYPERQGIAQLLAADTKLAPLYDFVAPDQVRHYVWRSAHPEKYVAEFARASGAYIADGHHRAASAARAATELGSRDPTPHGSEEHNWFLSALFPASELNILPYHRVVRDLNGLTLEQLLDKLRAIAELEQSSEPAPTSPGTFGMYTAGQWYRVRLPAESIDLEDPVGSLDYTLLYERVLRPILGIEDMRSDPRLDFVGGIRGTRTLEERVDAGRDAIAFAMRATSIDQLMRVADAGRMMPPKSTWFEPKLRSGLLIHTLS
jgi:uncharacterized protein (DUF1015 family)